MMRKILMVAALGVVAASLGVAVAFSGKENPPPNPTPAELESVAVVGPNGQALKCKGKVVKVKQKDLGAGIPDVLTPEEARDRGTPALHEFDCAKGKDGKDTGDITAKSSKKGMTVIVTIPATSD